MLARRLFLPVFALLATAAAPTTPNKVDRTKFTAPVLPEVLRHLDQAHSSLQNGEMEKALAHVQVVLVADEVRVAVVYDGISERLRGSCDKSVDRAIEAWEEALGGEVKFVRNDDPDAHLRIVFRPDVKLQGEAVAGLLNWKRTVGKESGGFVGKFRSEMLVRVDQPDGRPMPYDAIRHTVTHEMGHMFGLEDTDHVGELMGPLNVRNPLNGPCNHELKAARAVRKEALAIRAEARRIAN